MDFDSFSKDMNIKYDIASVSIYTLKNGVHNSIYGESISAIEEYSTYTKTHIKESAIGLRDDNKYKSRFITKFVFDDMEYIIVLSSFSVHTFKTHETEVAKELLTLGEQIYNTRR